MKKRKAQKAKDKIRIRLKRNWTITTLHKINCNKKNKE